MDLYRLTIQDSQDSMQFDLLDAPIKIEDVEGAVDNTVLSGDIFTDFLYLKKRWEQKWAIMCKDEYERLRGFYTRQWSLATVPSVKVTQGYLKDTEWEGQIIYINAPYGGEVSSLTKMTGDTFQQSYTGKNLVGNTLAGIKSLNQGGTWAGNSYTNSGITWTVYENSEGTIDRIEASGTATAAGRTFVIMKPTAVEFASKFSTSSTYTLSGCPSGGSSATYYVRVSSTPWKNMLTDTGDGATGALIPSSNYTSVNFTLCIDPAAGSVSGLVFKPQLELNSSATPFEPFVGGQPSPSPEYPQPIRTVTGEQTITINGTDFKINLGKNLFDKDNASIISGYVNASGTIVSGVGTRILYIQCKPNTTYTVQKTNSGTNQRFCVFDSALEPDVNVAILHSVGTRSGLDTASSYTITTEPTARYLGVFFRVTATTPSEPDILDTIQIEAGDTPTAYTAYKTPIEICGLGDDGNGYKDEIAFDGAEWKLRKTAIKAQITADIPWNVGSFPSQKRIYIATSYIFGESIVAPTDDTQKAVALSSHFTAVTLNDILNQTSDGFGISSSSYMSIRVGSATAASDILDILRNNTVEAYAVLRTPTETTITDTNLIAQLEAIRAALLEGQNLVVVTANGSNLPAKSITLQGIEGRENPILPQTNVRIGLSDGGVLNACECRQNVTLSMRETA